MNSTNNLDMQNGAVPGRQSHRCYKWKDDHGFVLGGLIRNGSDGLNLGNGTAQNCNPNLSPLRLLNLSTFEWQSSFDHTTDSAAYTVHRNISNVIGGGLVLNLVVLRRGLTII